MIKVSRFSDYGFDGQYQSFYKKQVDYLFSFREDQLPLELTDFARNLIITTIDKSRKKLNTNFKFFGIHVFFEPTSIKDVEFFLNHLASRPPVCFRGMPEDCPAYNLDQPYLQEISTLGKLYDRGFTGAFIPMEA